MPLEPHPFENLRVLVVENDSIPRDQARAFFEALSLPFSFSVSYASSVEEAMPLVPDSDAVLSSALYASGLKPSELPVGVEVARCCFQCGVPVALLSGAPVALLTVASEKQWQGRVRQLSDWSRLHDIGLFVHSIFKCPLDEIPVVLSLAQEKSWREAFCGVLYLRLGLLRRAFAIHPEKGATDYVQLPHSSVFQDSEALEQWREYFREWEAASKWRRNIRLWAFHFCDDGPYWEVMRGSLGEFDRLSKEIEDLLPADAFPRTEEVYE